MRVSAWPIVFMATVSGTPAAKSVAAPWRRPWNVIPSSPCFVAKSFHAPENVAGCHRSPIPLQTHEVGSHAERQQALALGGAVTLEGSGDEVGEWNVPAARSALGRA